MLRQGVDIWLNYFLRFYLMMQTMVRELTPYKPHLQDPGISKDVVGAVKVGDFRLDNQDAVRHLTEVFLKHLDVGFYILRHKNGTTFELWVHMELIDVDELIRSKGDTVRLKQPDDDRGQVVARQTMSKEIHFFTSLKDVILYRDLPIGLFTDIGQLDASKVCAVWGDVRLNFLNNLEPPFDGEIGVPFLLVSYDCNSETPYEVRSTGLGLDCASAALETFEDLVDHLLIYEGQALEQARLVWIKQGQVIKEIEGGQ